MTARFVPLVAVLLGLLTARAFGQNESPAATPRPVSVQELCLLLRSGYTGDEALRETAGRPLLAPLDAAAERALLEAGADARTVAALRTGRPVVSQAEAADVQQRQAASDQYRLEAWEAEQARLADASRAAMQAKLTARREEALKQVSTQLHDKLVVFAHNRLEPYDSATLAGKRLFLLYVAAGWDKSSLKLTPLLVDFYKKFAPGHPAFETVLISADRSATDMEAYLRQTQMPWPALAFDQLEAEPNLAALRQQELPRMLLIDGSGQTLADSHGDGKTIDAQRVFDAILNQTAANKPAAH